MKRWIVLACRLALAAIFFTAAIPKILSPHEFALAVFRYQMLPYALVNAFAIFLPWIELVAAVAILSPKSSRGAALILLALLAVFTAAISANLLRGLDISCGCFSVSAGAGRIGWWEVVRDAAFIVLCLPVLQPSRSPREEPPAR